MMLIAHVGTTSPIKNPTIPVKADGTRVEGGLTIHQPSGEQMSIYDAAMQCIDERHEARRLSCWRVEEVRQGLRRGTGRRRARNLLGGKAVCRA